LCERPFKSFSAVNVTFHTMLALGTAAVLSSMHRVTPSVGSFNRGTTLLPVIGFSIGILFHGVIDYLPHSYPIPSRIDIVLSLALAALAIAMSKPQNRLLVLACYLGCIFPDVVDLGPPAINRLFDWKLPMFKISPWHWPQYSGSIYDGTRQWESCSLHVVVVALSIGSFVRYRRALLRAGVGPDHS